MATSLSVAAGGSALLGAFGLGSGWFGSDKPSATEMLNYYYGKSGRLRSKIEAGVPIGLTGKKLRKAEKQMAKWEEKLPKAQASAVRYAQKLDRKHMMKPVEDFAGLEARRAAYEERIANPPDRGPRRSIMRTL